MTHDTRAPSQQLPFTDKLGSGSSAARMLFYTVTAIFATETAVMFLLMMLPPLDPGPEALVDSITLSILVFPFLYLTIFRPLLTEVERRRQVERALRSNQAFLDEAQRLAHVGHWVWHLEDGQMQWSKEIYRIFGYDPATTGPGTDPLFERTHPDDLDRVRHAFESCVAGDCGREIEHRVVVPDGVEKVIQIRAEKELGADGRVDRIIAVVQDVSSQRRAKEELERAYTELDQRVQERTAELAAANSALQLERNFVDAVVDTAGALVVVLDRQGNVERFNKTCELTSGYTFDEVTGGKFWDLVIPEDERAGVQRTFDELCSGIFPNRHQNHWLTRDGERRYISWFNSAICGAGGEVEHIIATGVDVTERRRAEEALRESEERYRTILRTAQDGYWTVDVNGSLLDVNDAYCAMIGYDRDELIGKNVTMVEVNEDLAAVREHIQKVATLGQDRFESRHRRKDGSLIELEISVTYLPFGGGQFFTFMRDVTERNRNAAELASKRAKLAAIIASNADAIVFTDPDRRIAMVNPAFERTFGYTADEVLGRTTHFLDVERRDSRETSQPNGSAMEKTGSFEVQCRRKDGSKLWVETVAVAVRDENDVFLGHVGVHRDISERRRTEAQVRASLHEKEILLKEIHHRVKNNLQVIASMLNLQADTVQDHRALATLRESQNRIRSLALIHEKLYQSHDLALIDFGEYVNDLAASIVSSVNRTPTPISIDSKIDDVDFGIDTAIPVALIVNELVSNSVKHAFAGRAKGAVHITLRSVAEGRFRLMVADDGIGLPDDLEKRGASSLGLQLVEVLAAQLDGIVTASTNDGARFEIVFTSADNGRRHA